ncbi:MAG: ATP/GTP-binding protein, partial [bacterium]|nr:ATP/GTP-binding protein [bacterium]
SDFCFDREMTLAMERHRTGEARVIPIILRPCDWQRAPFGQLQALPKDGKPVTSWPDRDQAFLDVAQGIRRAIAEMVKAPERKKPTAPTIFMVPYERNPYFTGREDVLDAVHEALRRGGSAALSQAEPVVALLQGTRTAISGLGGIGKTQTAVEYAYRHAGEYRAVFFVSAETEAELLGGYSRIAAALGLPEATAGDQEVVVAGVRKWLRTEDGWLLIFDNADRPELVKPFLPPRHRGRVLVTSRVQAFHAVGIRHPFRLESLPPADALAFLLARAAHRLGPPW